MLHFFIDAFLLSKNLSRGKVTVKIKRLLKATKKYIEQSVLKQIIIEKKTFPMFQKTYYKLKL